MYGGVRGRKVSLPYGNSLFSYSISLQRKIFDNFFSLQRKIFADFLSLQRKIILSVEIAIRFIRFIRFA